MDHHKGHTKRFLLRPHLTIHFSKTCCCHSRHQQSLDQWIQVVHHAGHRPINASCRPLARSPAARHTHRPSQRTHVPSTTPTPAARVRRRPATFADDAFTASALLTRCQLPTIPHVGKVGVGVSRPQRTTTMSTSHAAATTVTAQLQCPIRVAYK
ncbi:hypothetical protein ACLOJK_039719 [Asimina triloba]